MEDKFGDANLTQLAPNTSSPSRTHFSLAKVSLYPHTTQEFIYNQFMAKDFLSALESALESALRQYHPSSTLIPADFDKFDCYARTKLSFNPLFEPFADRKNLDVISVFPRSIDGGRSSKVTAVLINQRSQDKLKFNIKCISHCYLIHKPNLT